MTGEFYINGNDAYTTYGVTLADGSLSALMTPAPNKDYVTNTSAAAHGTQVYEGYSPKVAARDIQLTIGLHATSMSDFLSKYNTLVNVLQSGYINIKTKYQPSVTYRCLYISCQQFSQFNGRLAKIVIRLNEPNPNNRN